MGTLKKIQDMCSSRTHVGGLAELWGLDGDAVLASPPAFDWTPNESERSAILLQIADCALGTADNCGEGSEEAKEAREFYFSVCDKPLAEAKEDIQGFFFDAYEAVMGDIDKYYEAYPELRRIIRLTLGISREGRP